MPDNPGRPDLDRRADDDEEFPFFEAPGAELDEETFEFDLPTPDFLGGGGGSVEAPGLDDF
jgi:hypothetical protein